MSHWRFLVTRNIGGNFQRRETCALIKRQVEQRGLSNLIPLVKYELGKQKEYYLGLAVNASDGGNGQAEEELARQILVDVGVKSAANRQSCFLVNAEEVKRLLGGSLECESFTVPMHRELEGDLKNPDPVDFLSTADLEDLLLSDENPQLSDHYSNLMSWLSAVGAGGIDRIRQACQAIFPERDWQGAWSLLRRLVLLGHAEFDGGISLRWSVIPPALVTAIEDPNRRIYVGQRTPQIVKFLQDNYLTIERPQEMGPPRIQIRTDEREIHYKPGHLMLDAGCAAQRFADSLPTIDIWKKLLPTWSESDFDRFDCERYDAQLDQFHGISGGICLASPGLYRFKLPQSSRGIETLTFFDPSGNRWICGDFYGLRFLARTCVGNIVVLRDATSSQLVLSSSERWPMPYERALVLASGLLPRQYQLDSGRRVLIYEGVTQSFALQMAQLVGVELKETACTT